jgi:hypothetical protein
VPLETRAQEIANALNEPGVLRPHLGTSTCHTPLASLDRFVFLLLTGKNIPRILAVSVQHLARRAPHPRKTRSHPPAIAAPHAYCCTPETPLLKANPKAPRHDRNPNMKIRHFAVCSLAVAALSAHAGDAPTSQWRMTETSLFDLVQNGYSIVAVTGNASRNDASSEDTFFLQRTNSVYKCFDAHDAEARAKRGGATAHCFELIKADLAPSGK